MESFPHDDDSAIALIQHRKNTRNSASLHHHGPVLKNKIRIHDNFTKLLLPGLLRCLISWLLIGGFYISLWKYKDRVLSPKSKSQFDAIMVALSIAFGLNVASALKAIALDLRWWILSMGKRPEQEVELILRGDSMAELLRLLLIAPHSRTLAVALPWLLLNMLIQSSIAILGLTYSASPGIADIYREPGINSIAVPNMTHFAPSVGRFSDDNTFTESYAAHVLGDIGSSYNASALPEEPLVGKPWASYPAGLWSATDHWEYRFLESAPSLLASGAQAQFLAIYSDRVAKSNATCKVPPFQIANDGQLAKVRLMEDNRTFIFPTIAEGMESVYYLTAPILANGDSDWGCGPGCNSVKVLEPAAGPPIDGSFVNGSSTAFFFYECNITITAPTTDIPTVRAAQAAQAIALSGQIHSEFQNISDLGNSGTNQFVAYNFGTPFGEPQNNSAKGMASLVSRFAIGVISAAAQTNPPMIVLGSLPAQGVRVQFDSFLIFNLILVITGTLQLALVLVTAAIVSRLTIPQEILLSHDETIQKRFILSS